MTVVAYRDGVLASDSNVTSGGVILGEGKKVLKTQQGFLLGGAGSYGTLSKFFTWFEDETEDRPDLTELDLSDFEGLIVHPDGDLVLIDPSGFPMEIKAPFYTFGSGGPIAQGALEAGATAIEAVKIAIKWSSMCGGKVQSVKL